jgi:hypothetical protein
VKHRAEFRTIKVECERCAEKSARIAQLEEFRTYIEAMARNALAGRK